MLAMLAMLAILAMLAMITFPLDDKYGLDEQAVTAMKKWVFKPGTKDGKPVAVRVDVEMSFRLR
jgi:Gram-negative bacterial TonB protein C-terminal